jgi:hypothetical protein
MIYCLPKEIDVITRGKYGGVISMEISFRERILKIDFRDGFSR